jgi:hypothetical protein
MSGTTSRDWLNLGDLPSSSSPWRAPGHGPLNEQEVALSETKKHRKFTVQQKAELVLASFRGDRSIAEICRGRDISEALLRRWRDQMIEAGGRNYRRPRGNSTSRPQREVAH